MSLGAPPMPTPDLVRRDPPRRNPMPPSQRPTPLSRRSMLLPAAAFAVFATSMSLAQVFLHQLWLGPSILAIGLAFGAGWVSRRLDVPGFLAPALSLLALVALLGIVFHAGTTAVGFPTAGTMRAIGESLTAAQHDIRALAAPAEATPGLTLLATAGVFLVAMLVEIMVFRLNRPVAAGMPLLALYLIPTAMTNHANAFAFIVATTGYLTLLVAEGRDRARSWGRRLTGIDLVDDTADVSHVARVGRRIGVAAVLLALCVPLALPSVGKGMFGGSGSGLFGKGNSSTTVTVINPIVELRGRLRDNPTTQVLTMRTSGAPDYLRLTTLDAFDGSQWQLGRQEGTSENRVGKKNPIPQPLESSSITTDRTTYEIEVDDLAVRWLPLPYVPALVDVDGDWRYEPSGYAVFSTHRTSRDVDYTVDAMRPAPTVAQLRAGGEIPAAITARYLSVPQNPPPIATEVLSKVTAGKATAYDKALALQQYFHATGGFHYTLEVDPGTGVDALTSFLTKKEGYCEQFAAAMAYLARLAAIPARVAIGFTPGQPRNDGSYSVRNSDAHAWPELYFPKVGWVRFEPTPRVGTDTPSYAIPPTGAGGIGNGLPDPGPATDDPGGEGADDPRDVRGPREANENLDDPATATPQGRRAATPFRLPLIPTALVLAVVVLVTPTAVGFGTRRRRGARAGDGPGRIHAAWASLADAAEDAGHHFRSADSPRAAARRLAGAASLPGPAAEALASLAHAEERARYAPSAPAADGVDADLRAVRHALRASLSGWARVRSTVFPASSVRRIRETFRRGGDAAERFRTAVAQRAAGVVRRRRARPA